jgi:hypothetical protein
MNPHADYRKIEIATMRDYLLGKLPGARADDLEARYFADPSVLRRVKDAERALIGDYLDGRLPEEDTASFVARYENIPALKQVLEEERRKRPAPGPRISFRRPVMIAAPVAVALALGVWFGPQWLSPPVALILTPGVSKAGGSGATLVLPARGPVDLMVQLTEEEGAVSSQYQVRLAEIRPDGTRAPIALPNSFKVSSKQLSVALDSKLLRPGDYIVELIAPDSEVKESYLFRAVSPPHR